MRTAKIVEQLVDIDASAWDGLHDGRNPFVSHAFLSGLETHDCLLAHRGWVPQHLTLWDGDALVAAAPMYRKVNSHGEFVFDHAWAHAYAQHGLDYFPKWLCAVPYSPVPGPRLLARTTEDRALLLAAIRQVTTQTGMSSAHINFLQADDAAVFEGTNAREWLERIDVQYHWHNNAGWTDFESFLAAFNHKNRKNIRQERSKLQRSGVTFRVVHGRDASDADLDAMHGFYRQTFAEYGNHAALTRPFFTHLATTLPDALVMFFAVHDDVPVAGALCLRGEDTLYGRYWGSSEQRPGLHFETCYYQGIDYCLREGLARFEPGAQGEHKLARGFLPTIIRSRHWIAHPQFRGALREWCASERASIERYAASLTEHSPFKVID